MLSHCNLTALSIRKSADPLPNPFEGSARSRARAAGTLSRLAALSWRHRASLAPFAELLTAPASHVLDRRAQEQPSPSLFRSSAAQRLPPYTHGKRQNECVPPPCLSSHSPAGGLRTMF